MNAWVAVSPELIRGAFFSITLQAIAVGLFAIAHGVGWKRQRTQKIIYFIGIVFGIVGVAMADLMMIQLVIMGKYL